MKTLGNLFFFAISSILGLGSVILPTLVTPGIRWYDAPLFPLVRMGIEGFSVMTLVFLILSGGVVGFLRPRYAWLWGVTTVYCFQYHK